MTEWRNAVLIRYLSWKYLKQNLLLLDFCKVTPIEPRKRVVRVVGPNFELPGFGATFANNAIFGHFHPLSLLQISEKLASHSKMAIFTTPSNFRSHLCHISTNLNKVNEVNNRKGILYNLR